MLDARKLASYVTDMGKQSRLSIKGQVTIPDDVRAELGLEPGDLVTFERSGGTVRVARGHEDDPSSFESRLARARALAGPRLLGMTTDEYMLWIREPLPPYAE